MSETFRVSSSGSMKAVTLKKKKSIEMYNSHNIQFTHLNKGYSSVALHSKNCATFTTITFRTFHYPQKKVHAS